MSCWEQGSASSQSQSLQPVLISPLMRDSHRLLSAFRMRVKPALGILQSWNKLCHMFLLPLSHTSPRCQVCQKQNHIVGYEIFILAPQWLSVAPRFFLCSREISLSFYKTHKSCRCCGPANQQEHFSSQLRLLSCFPLNVCRLAEMV